jgi:tetratricopeptide (TPR) repeat protein
VLLVGIGGCGKGTEPAEPSDQTPGTPSPPSSVTPTETSADTAAPPGETTAADAPPRTSPPPTDRAVSADQPRPAITLEELEVPEVDLGSLPIVLQTKIGDARYRAQRAPSDVEKVGTLGAMYYAHGFDEAAVASFRQATRLFPDQYAWWYYLARAQQKAGDRARAIAAFRKMLELEGNYMPARVRLAELLMEDNLSEARQMLETVLEWESNYPGALYVLGRVSMAAGDHKKAEECFRRVLRLVPSYLPAHTRLAECLEAQGRSAEAQPHRKLIGEATTVLPMEDPLEALLMDQGLHKSALLRAGNALVADGQLEQADTILQIAADVAPDDVNIQNGIAGLRLAQERTDDAIKLLEDILAERPEYSPARVNLVIAHIQKNDTATAERLLRELLADEPYNSRALAAFCQLASEQQKPQEAAKMLDAAAASLPDDPTLQLQVAQLFQQLQMSEKAEAAIRRSLELWPGYAMAQYMLGELMLQKGDLAAAETAWRAAVAADPALSPARLRVLGMMLQRGERQEAEKLLREGLEMVADGEMANALAWILATSPDASQRNGEEAVVWAERACQVSRFLDPTHLDTLAAAYAEVGRFDEAKNAVSRAIQLAQSQNRGDILADFQMRLKLYEQEKPFHETE